MYVSPVIHMAVNVLIKIILLNNVLIFTEIHFIAVSMAPHMGHIVIKGLRNLYLYHIETY